MTDPPIPTTWQVPPRSLNELSCVLAKENTAGDAGKRSDDDDDAIVSDSSPLTYWFSWPNNTTSSVLAVRGALLLISNRASVQSRTSARVSLPSRVSVLVSLCILCVLAKWFFGENTWWRIQFNRKMNASGRILVVATATLLLVMATTTTTAAMTNQDVYPGEHILRTRDDREHMVDEFSFPYAYAFFQHDGVFFVVVVCLILVCPGENLIASSSWL